jgi:hypothetical protein
MKNLSNFISQEFAYANTPKVNATWSEKTDEIRKESIISQLQLNKKFNNLEVVSADRSGNVILKIMDSIPAGIRGEMLLNLEEMLKKNIDNGITIWLTPVGDKSKLRKLRGVEIKT